MRRARCIGLTAPIVILGSRESLTLVAGWEGDLDLIVGERAAERDADGQVIVPARTETLADHLGPHLQHFEILAPEVASGDRPGRRRPSPAPPTRPESEE